MKRWRLAPLLAFFLVGLSNCAPESPPNILILLLDDFGYNDLALNAQASGLTEEALHTPVMDNFARQGVHFTRHYTESTCSPSRAALLSGRYPARFGFTAMAGGFRPRSQPWPKRSRAPAIAPT